MQSTLRTKIAAAAMLLVPMGAMLAVQPASAREVVKHGPHAVQRDTRAPTIHNITPDQGDRVSDRGQTRISASFKDDRSGVDPRSVTLRVDGRDVTRRARVDGNDVRYTENLRPGRHTAEVVVRDRAGNVTRRAWTFAVVDRDLGRFGYGYGR